MKKRSWFLFLCLGLSGCSSNLPNPCLEDTITILEPTQKTKKVVVSEKEEPWYGLYDEKDVIGRIYFEFDSDVVSERDQQYLQSKLLPWLNEHPQQRVLLAGYADWIGQEEYNKDLGLRRAQKVAEVFTQNGMATSRLDVITLGNREATQGISKADGVKDRRCDIVQLH